MKPYKAPIWRKVTGPISFEQIINLREAYSRRTVLHKEYHDSRNRDFVKMASYKAEMLVDATLNTDSRLTASLLKQM